MFLQTFRKFCVNEILLLRSFKSNLKQIRQVKVFNYEAGQIYIIPVEK